METVGLFFCSCLFLFFVVVVVAAMQVVVVFFFFFLLWWFIWKGDHQWIRWLAKLMFVCHKLDPKYAFIQNEIWNNCCLLLCPVTSFLLVSTQAALAENYWEYAHWSSSSSFHAEAVNAELCETLGATVKIGSFRIIIPASCKGCCLNTLRDGV